MRVLVAGGAGYIGSVVTAALLADGHEVTVLDDLSTGHADAVPSGARLEAVRAVGCRRIVFSSTAATYGEPESVPIREDAPTRPTNTYGASKLAVDHMLTSYAVAHGFAAVRLAYFNVAGGAFGLGERPAAETPLV